MVLKRPKNRNTPKNGWTKKFYSPKDSKKGKIFEIGSPEVWEKGGGVPLPRVYTIMRPYMLYIKSF